MKIQIILVLTAFVCCNCAPTSPAPGTTAAPVTAGPVTTAQPSASSTSRAESVKDRLLKSVVALDARVKTEIQKLKDENREHLALTLQEEEKRVDQIAAELKTTTGPEALRLLEEELVRVERRVAIEEILLERESRAQDFLLADAKALKEYVAEEVKKLEAVTGRNRNTAQQIARTLRRDEQRLEQLAQELTKAQSPRNIGIFEVELRAIEVRISEELRRLGFKPPTPTGTPGTATAAPVTSERPQTTAQAVTTARPATAAPVTSERPQTTAAASKPTVAAVSTTK